MAFVYSLPCIILQKKKKKGKQYQFEILMLGRCHGPIGLILRADNSVGTDWII